MLKDGSTRLWRLWVPLIASCLLATSCSFVRLGYDFFPTWALWQIDSYLTMDTGQRLIARRRLIELHQWHRQEQLPSYVDFIGSLRKRAPTSMSVQEATAIRERVQSAWAPVAAKLAPGMAELLVTVQPEQLDEMKKEFARSNRKLRTEYLPSDRLSARAKRIGERLEYFLGDLSPAQLRQVRQASDAMPDTEELRLTEREARQQRLVTLIERLSAERADPARAERLVRDYLLTLWVSPDPARQARLDETSRAGDALTARIIAQASPAQHATLTKRLMGWEQTFVKLIQEQR